MTYIQRLMLRRRPRRAAVLILVIVLLVLMALMGIAYMASARTDRAASSQNIVNTQIELLLDGVRAISNAEVIADLSPDPKQYRPFDDADYEHYDTTVGVRDQYLAARAPVRLEDIARPFDSSETYDTGDIVIENNEYFVFVGTNRIPLTGADPDGNPSSPGPALGPDAVLWSAVSRPGTHVFINPAGGENGTAMEAVRMYNGQQMTEGRAIWRLLGNPLKAGLADNATGPKRTPMFPMEVTVGGQKMPGLRLYLTDGPIDTVAADTDADGIADALLFSLDFEQNGVKYYAAVRIIDNNSAVNLATAAGRDERYPGQHYFNFFPSNYDVGDLLNPQDDLEDLVDAVAGGDLPQDGRMYRYDRQPVLGAEYRTEGDFHWMRSGRRLDNRSYTTANRPPYHPYGGAIPSGDASGLARRFVLSEDVALTDAERLLTHTLPKSSLEPYAPADVKQWYDDHFAEGSGSLRGQAVARNPVSNATPVKSSAANTQPPAPYGDLASGTNYQEMPAYSPIGVKANVNTSGFPELWQAYWSVMVGNTSSDGTFSRPPAYVHDPSGTPAQNAGKMFRDVDRVDRSHFAQQFSDLAAKPANQRTPAENEQMVAANNASVGINVPSMVLLRSALAAVNTIDLRDADDDVTVMEFEHQSGGENRKFRVYGYEPQPFITEWVIYKHWDTVQDTLPDGSITETAVDPKHFVAVELFNPYNRPLNLKDYSLALTDRMSGWPRTLQVLMAEGDWNTQVGAALGGSATNVMIPALGRVVLHNHDPASNNVLPATAPNLVQDIPGPKVYVPKLGDAVGQELVILRPQVVGQLAANESSNPALRVPIDQMDLTGLVPYHKTEDGYIASTNFPEWNHYARPNDETTLLWDWVHPGPYTVYPVKITRGANGGTTEAPVLEPKTKNKGRHLRYEGMAKGTTAPPGAMNLGAADPGTYTAKFRVPLSLAGWPGPETTSGSTLAYPFGGFARNGDILKVPFIGRYRIQYIGRNPLQTSQVVSAMNDDEFAELNSISMDAAYADDFNDTNDAQEQLGRFVPLISPSVALPTGNASSQPNADTDYGWAGSLFDYLSVETPHSDFMPNISKEAYWALLDKHGHKPQNMNAQQEQDWQNANTPEAVANSRPGAAGNTDTEKLIGVEGLVNLNTAPWQLIARLPLLPFPNTINATTLQQHKDEQAALAKAIVAYRQHHGPFRSLFELNRVPDFADAMGNFATTDFERKHGDLADLAPAGGNFDERYMMVNRISNHVTLRSDSFTVYVIVQGWRDAGTSNARLVAQRRDAFIVDRTSVRRQNPELIIRSVPQD